MLSAAVRACLRSFRLTPLYLVPLTCIFIVTGCGHLHHAPPPEYVYVVAQKMSLRDRVAPISNLVAPVTNGERLQVVGRRPRFLDVKDDQGRVGWIEEHAVIDQALHDQFEALRTAHAHDPVVATAVLSDDLYLHLKPGRKTERYYLLPENDKLQLLVRASIPKPIPPQAMLAPVAQKRAAKGKPANGPEPPRMEDWWLVRDAQGHVGWLISRGLNVDVPDSIASYAESQRMVGAYVLTKVFDPDSNLPGKMVPEYVSVLSPYKAGLPYDFDQIRIFTWNTKKHRYETAYREHGLEGYLPVTVTTQTFDKQGPEPVFSFKTAVNDSGSIDPATGELRQGQTETRTYRMEGVIVKRVLPPGAAPAAVPATRHVSRRHPTAHRNNRHHEKRRRRHR